METFDPARAALLVMDFQNYGLDPKGYWPQRMPELGGRFTGAVKNTERALAAARRKRMTIVFVGQAWRDGHPDANVDAPWQAEAKAGGPHRAGDVGRRVLSAADAIEGPVRTVVLGGPEDRLPAIPGTGHGSARSTGSIFIACRRLAGIRQCTQRCVARFPDSFRTSRLVRGRAGG